MKTRISKSAVMKRAWAIYRGTSFYASSFSLSLKRAWAVEKENIKYRVEKAARKMEETRNTFIPKTRSFYNNSYSPEMVSSLTNYYAGSGYHGD